MASSIEHHEIAEQLLDEARQRRADRRPTEECDVLRWEASIHANLATAAALRDLAAAPAAATALKPA
jgi:hypothetical protein